MTIATKKTTRRHPVAPEDDDLLRAVFDPQISPDAKRVAYVVRSNEPKKNEYQMSIWVVPLDGKQPARRFTFGTKDHAPRWSPDGRSLAFLADRGEKTQIFLAPLDGGESRQLTTTPHGVNELVWSPDGKRIAYTARVGEWKDARDRSPAERAAPRVIKHLLYRFDGIGYLDDRRMHIFTVDAESGEARQITDGDWYDQQPSWSRDGKWIVFSSDRESARHDRPNGLGRSDVWVVASAGGRARKLTRSRGAAVFPAFSRDGRLVAFQGHENGDAGFVKNFHVMVVPTTGGTAPRSISAGVEVLRGAPLRWLPDGKTVVFLVTERGTQTLYRAGVANGSTSKMLGGDRHIQQFSLSRAADQIAFTASWPSQPPELYARRLGSGARERNLSHANAAFMSVAELGTTRRMTHRAPDGLEIESFVLYPVGYKAGRRYPLVLYIHGGPHMQHPPPFAMRQESLAGAGYLVLMPNPRGSEGYGETFRGMCVRDWGGKDYEDLMTAVDALVQRGVADPERLFVTGYSYGGFMSAWVVGHTGRFRAAIIGAPIADHISRRGTWDCLGADEVEVGSPWENLEEVWQRSPIAHLPHCTTPVLIEHHEGDLRCPIGQGDEVFQTLKLLGKEVEYLRYPGGFHNPDSWPPSQNVDYMRRQIAWFDGHGGRVRAERASRDRARTAKASRNGLTGTHTVYTVRLDGRR